MKSTRNLRLRLRLTEGALVLLLGALTTGAVATHQLLLDATNRPTDDVSFSGPHWVGTLDAARLPASVPLLDIDGNLSVSGKLNATGGTHAGRIDISNSGGNIFTSNGGGNLDTSGGGGTIDTGDTGGPISTKSSGGRFDTSNGGGYILTNGYGAPIDSSAPLGSVYMDQDPAGASGHVLWVMEPTGWVGK